MSIFRSQPATIIRRFISIIVASALSVLMLYLDSSDNPKSWNYFVYSVRSPNFLRDIVTPIVVTIPLFAGPTILDISNGRLAFEPFIFNRRNVLQFLKNYVIGPITEEIVFRAINCSIMIVSLSKTSSIFISSILFGVVHFHPYIMQFVFKDMERQNLSLSLLQIGYTTLFGMYVATIFLATKSLWASVIVHAFCNYVGLPNIPSIIENGTSMVLLTISGIVAWLYLFITHYLSGL